MKKYDKLIGDYSKPLLVYRQMCIFFSLVFLVDIEKLIVDCKRMPFIVEII